MKKFTAAAIIICMLCMVFTPSYAAEPAIVRMMAEKGSGTFYYYTSPRDREKVEVNDAIIIKIEIEGCEEADVCSGIMSLKYDAALVKCLGCNSETAGTWEAKDNGSGIMQMAFSSATPIADGVVFKAAFEPYDTENTETVPFSMEINELLTGDVADGDVPCEYVTGADKINLDIPTYYGPVTELLMGDANDDGTVNTADAAYVLRYAADMIQLTDKQLSQANVNFDEGVNTADATLILKYAAGMITEF